MSCNNQTLESLQIFPSDEDEADRIQLKNDLVKLAFEGEFSLPFNYNDLQNCKILDIGCGPGAWCIDLSTKYPHIDVIGVDNIDMFPAECNLPKNCQLMVANVLYGLKEFADASFDVIHIRFMVLSFTSAQYSQVIKSCWRLLKPGGYIEILETDLIVYSAGPVTQKLNQESK
ncbi:S-adenosyl-L-methionine-dependent methyltransferase [Cokeromyces recurvatus]|uniref:S-adenosyl-L-methionine-dependent methyltransferase n=1 Tax=Cokeromyces recurvatus TaxID=90255 RepID=UPI00221EB9D3|nr:S-adenosyl-L-methionine-dependent methyltransferase [Cokeromyces recurvatus]KAI7901773.1 S-adenosyl-L-methionine-dependent methyltransferase [Cokeromyces recurvatus]